MLRYEDAIKEFDKAIELDPNIPAYHNNKEAALIKLGRHEDAIKEFDKVKKLGHNNPN